MTETKKMVQNYADEDTPKSVNVPQNVTSLLIWAAGRWGIGILVAAVFALATKQVYADLTELNREVLRTVRANTESTMKVAQAIKEITDAVEANGESIRRLERGNPFQE